MPTNTCSVSNTFETQKACVFSACVTPKMRACCRSAFMPTNTCTVSNTFEAQKACVFSACVTVVVSAEKTQTFPHLK
ncbi:hypothetical protein O1D97_07755 [Marinomonas sp. 15G1-11]|uniref:Uncharacterized protein n=1 Tax=Marinomonas phaeophyticola TaxID=3004091 RepID=A0ABT4JT93_9GAMM|nr:hypothetical protein [Marinomonas sp. 15G1-11]MCZ2721550.1 hypothetical protein [Marinomonas sp. 15G1-11]